jgi:hydrogenase expression/formation protein HypC
MGNGLRTKTLNLEPITKYQLPIVSYSPLPISSSKVIKMCLGIPGQIVEITSAEQKLAIVDVSGVKRQVNIACIVDDDHPVETCLGDWVLVHVGFAMNRIDPTEAAETLTLLEELAEVHQAMATSGMN